MSSTEAKAAGNAAFKEGKFEEAVEQFTLAIESDPTDHVLFSNRSGAQAKLGKYTAALLDANKCIELKPDWAKGHSRRGAAYVGLTRWKQAQLAYEKGLKLDPDNASMHMEAARLSAMFNKTGSASSGVAPPSTAAAPPAGSLSSKVHGSLSVNVLVFAFLYLMPLIPRTIGLAYRISMGSMIGLLLNALVATHGLSYATLKNPNVWRSTEVQTATLCLLMLVAPPVPMALMPLCATALGNVCRRYANLLAKLPTVVSTRAAFLNTAEGEHMTQAFGAVSEIIVAGLAPLSLVTQGFRALPVAFLYFQHVARRHATSQLHQQAVSALATNLGGVFNHRYAPSFLGRLFDRLKSLVALLASKVV